MSKIALETKTKEQEYLKNYLEENASDTLADKINNGVKIVKDGLTLLNKKTMETFMNYATGEAKKLAEQDARYAMVDDKTVCGWLMHYFEEDSIEGVLYNEDGTPYKKPAPIKKASVSASVPKAPAKKHESEFISMFDGIEDIFQNLNNQDNQNDNEITFEPPDFEPPEFEPPKFEPPIFEPPVVEEKPKYSPLHLKYLKYQEKYPNLIVILRLGDFYEVFGENAITIGNLLELTITGRDIGNGERTPMVGYPYHVSDAYLNKIIKDFSVVVIENENEEKVYDKIERVKDSDTFVQVSTGEVIDDFDFNIEIVAKLYEIFDGEMEAS